LDDAGSADQQGRCSALSRTHDRDAAFNHNFTLVGISLTYCHAAERSSEMSPKEPKLRPGIADAGHTIYVPTSTSVLPGQAAQLAARATREPSRRLEFSAG
jgi:hypothetical protein